MNEDTRMAATTAAVGWLMLSAAQALIGGLDRETAPQRVGPMRRIEVVFPAYRIGYWLLGELHPR